MHHHHTSSSNLRLPIAVFVGLAIGLVLGMILFSTEQQHHDFCASTSSQVSQIPSTSPPVLRQQMKNQKEEKQEVDHHHDDDIFSKSNHLVWPCDSTFDLNQIRQRYAKMQSENEDTIGSKLFSKDTLHLTVKHFKTTMSILKDENFRKCWSKINENRRKEAKQIISGQKHFFFYDLGSRKLDQTMNFLTLYPGAKQFNIICVEPNPSFNPFYQKVSNNNKVFHLNAAVGIAKDSLLLSNRHVGSSIIKEKNLQHQKQQVSQNDSQVVRVLPFLDAMLGTHQNQENSWLGEEATNQNGKRVPLPPVTPPPRSNGLVKIVVKMDVEKAEFSIIHHMLRSGALSMIDEFLLECHYNTNLPREKRDPVLHIGYDDCVDLVNAIRDAANYNNNDEKQQMEVVLWNSVKTATRSGRGYIERHNGFFPT